MDFDEWTVWHATCGRETASNEVGRICLVLMKGLIINQ